VSGQPANPPLQSDFAVPRPAIARTMYVLRTTDSGRYRIPVGDTHIVAPELLRRRWQTSWTNYTVLAAGGRFGLEAN
jgi:hypothetical protein